MMGRRSIRKEVKSAQFARISWWKKKGRDGGQQGCVEGRRRLQVFVASMSNESQIATRPGAFSLVEA
jgi:hypothetical protein